MSNDWIQIGSLFLYNVMCLRVWELFHFSLVSLFIFLNKFIRIKFIQQKIK